MILCISDLHLDAQRPDITALFLKFLDERVRRHVQALYILGDLFEAWIGDDVDSELAHQVANGIRIVVDSGVFVGFIRGNRDFLLGDHYATQCGMSILPDMYVFNCYDIPTLLMHGDTLCTKDRVYQTMREQLRSSQWQQQFLKKSVEQRQQFAQQARKESQIYTSEASAEWMDVEQDTVEQAMKAFGVSRLIHGHTHRPAVHKFNLNNHSMERIVLGDWYTQGSVLALEPGTYELQTLLVQ